MFLKHFLVYGWHHSAALPHGLPDGVPSASAGRAVFSFLLLCFSGQIAGNGGVDRKHQNGLILTNKDIIWLRFFTMTGGSVSESGYFIHAADQRIVYVRV